MASAFKKLFEVRFSHAFYADGVNPDLVVEPTEPCHRFIAGHHLLFRPGAGEFAVFYPAGGEGMPEIGFEEAVSLHFSLRLTNPFFSNFTDLPHKTREAAYLFSNRETPGELQTGEVVLPRGVLPPLHVAGGKTSADPELFTAEGEQIFAETVPVKEGLAHATRSLRGFAGGLYRLDAAGAEPRWVYVHRAMGAPWFGLLDLRFVPSRLPPQAPPPLLEIGFAARAAQWKYQVVLNHPDENVQYRIVQLDAAFSTGAPPGNGLAEETETEEDEREEDEHGKRRRRRKGGKEGSPLGPQPPPPEPKTSPPELYFSEPASVELGEGKKMLEFLTAPRPGRPGDEGLIPYRQEPRKHITLVSYGNGTGGLDREQRSNPTPLLEDLPNPSPHQADPLVTIQV